MTLARQEAIQNGHSHIGTEHLAIALRLHKTPALEKIWGKLPVDPEALRRRIEVAVPPTLGGPTPTGRSGTETWTGTLEVPGLEFDVTRPTLSGAVNKTVRAPRRAERVRVRFTVTAKDAVDGSVPGRCRPRSGNRFKLGKTRVTCAATDKSGNTATAKFIVTVRARR